MEVHAHTHTPRKKWTHYLWEFLMLFLAVFCGFLAENFREHQVEHQREKQFMQSLLVDIRQDSLELNKKALAVLRSIKYQDSLLLFLYNNPPVDFLSDYFSDILTTYALPRHTIVFSDVTAIQLKNAGNLRLIRKQDVVRNTLLYWKEQEETKNNLERFIIYRNRGRELEEKLFAFSDYDLVEDHLIKAPAKGVRVIQSDTILWAQFANIISHCRITAKQLAESLQNLLRLASDLMLLLKKEYHLK